MIVGKMLLCIFNTYGIVLKCDIVFYRYSPDGIVFNFISMIIFRVQKQKFTIGISGGPGLPFSTLNPEG